MNKKKTTKNISSKSSSDRKQRGRVDRTAMFPVAPPVTELPADYPAWLAELKKCIQNERIRVILASNAAMVMLYWDIGQRILEKQDAQGWGAGLSD